MMEKQATIRLITVSCEHNEKTVRLMNELSEKIEKLARELGLHPVHTTIDDRLFP